jgi:hypothetical protein
MKTLSALMLTLSIAGMAAMVNLVVADEGAKPAWQTKFNEVYRLADGQNARFIPRPFIPERDAYHAEHHPQIANHPGQYGFRWTDGKPRQAYWSTDEGTVASALYMAGIDRADLDGISDVFELKVPGDWIVRYSAGRDAMLADIRRELSDATDGAIRVEPARVEREVIVARGRFTPKPLPDAPREPKAVHLYIDKLDSTEGAGGGTASMDGFLRHVGDTIGLKVIDETEPHKGNVEWANNHSVSDAQKSSEKRDALLKNVTEQTGLEFKLERRPVDVWRVIDTTNKSGGL